MQKLKNLVRREFLKRILQGGIGLVVAGVPTHYAIADILTHDAIAGGSTENNQQKKEEKIEDIFQVTDQNYRLEVIAQRLSAVGKIALNPSDGHLFFTQSDAIYEMIGNKPELKFKAQGGRYGRRIEIEINSSRNELFVYSGEALEERIDLYDLKTGELMFKIDRPVPDWKFNFLGQRLTSVAANPLDNNFYMLVAHENPYRMLDSKTHSIKVCSIKNINGYYACCFDSFGNLYMGISPPNLTYNESDTSEIKVLTKKGEIKVLTKESELAKFVGRPDFDVQELEYDASSGKLIVAGMGSKKMWVRGEMGMTLEDARSYLLSVDVNTGKASVIAETINHIPWICGLAVAPNGDIYYSLKVLLKPWRIDKVNNRLMGDDGYILKFVKK